MLLSSRYLSLKIRWFFWSVESEYEYEYKENAKVDMEYKNPMRRVNLDEQILFSILPNELIAVEFLKEKPR